MQKDYRKEVENDIKKFLAAGKLPTDYDVRHSNGKTQSSPYWNYVKTNKGGFEPLFNSGEVPVEETAEATHYGHLFSQWLALEFPKLPEEDRELFTLFWEKKVSEGNLATYFSYSLRMVQRRIQSMRNNISAFVGVRE